MERNSLLHGRTPKTEEEILSRIRWEVRARILAKINFLIIDGYAIAELGENCTRNIF